MRLFLIFLVSFAISLSTSYFAYKLYKIDIPPSVVSLALIILWMVIPDKYINKITGKKE
jgi:hypothetical protein